MAEYDRFVVLGYVPYLGFVTVGWAGDPVMAVRLGLVWQQRFGVRVRVVDRAFDLVIYETDTTEERRSWR